MQPRPQRAILLVLPSLVMIKGRMTILWRLRCLPKQVTQLLACSKSQAEILPNQLVGQSWLPCMVKMGRLTLRSSFQRLVLNSFPFSVTLSPTLLLPKTFCLRMLRHWKKHYLVGLTSSKRSPPSSKKSTCSALACAMTSSKASQESLNRTGCFSLCPRCTSVATKKRIPQSYMMNRSYYNYTQNPAINIKLATVTPATLISHFPPHFTKEEASITFSCCNRSQSDSKRHIVNIIMGQSQCSEICGDQQPLMPFVQLPRSEIDEPLESAARLVKQHIQLHSKVKETYVLYRTLHQAQRKGTKLPLYYLFDYAAYYEGDWKNGRPHGFGRIIYDDGSLYEGCFRDGIAECRQALFIKDDSTFYRGSIKHKKANGYGQLSTPKLFYKGHWVNDIPQGKAREIYSSISFYQGEFVDGMKTGDGTYYWNASEYYIGKFNKNKLEGMGDLTTKEYQYKGQFKDGKKEGKGVYTDFFNKFEYRGNFQKNIPRGQGEIIYADGVRFTGIFDGFSKRKGILQIKGQQVQVNTLEYPQVSLSEYLQSGTEQ